jgi:DNA polymerase-3 subunit beta
MFGQKRSDDVNFELAREALLEPLSLASAVAPKKTSRPILSCVLIEAQRGKVSLRATDEEMSVAYHVSSDHVAIKGEGACAVSVRDLADIVRSLKPNVPVEIELLAEGNQIAVRQEGGRICFELHALPAIDFPESRGIPDEGISLQAAPFLHRIDECLYAVSDDEARYYLKGIFFEHTGEDGKLILAATDGHRLASTAQENIPNLGQSKALVPTKLLSALRKLLAGQTTVKVAFKDKRAFFAVDGAELSGLLIEATFPDYRQVIPTKTSFAVRVKKQFLAEALKRVLLLSPDKSGGVQISCREGEEKIVISSASSGKGQAREAVQLERFSGRFTGGESEFVAGFNASYFLDALGGFGAKEVEISFTNHLSPSVVKGVGDDGVTAAYPFSVVMPMRL